MANKKILLIGGGGHCRSVLDSLFELDIFDEIGLVERPDAEKNSIATVKTVGCDDDLLRLFNEGWTDAFITLGSVGNTVRREALYALIKSIGFRVPSIIDPSAAVSKTAVLGEGVFVAKNAIINAGAKIGDCAIINSGAVVEHDCVIEGFVHMAPKSVACGDVTVKKGAHIGAGSVIRQQITVGENALIGICSAVVSNIEPNCVAFGNPCRKVNDK